MAPLPPSYTTTNQTKKDRWSLFGTCSGKPAPKSDNGNACVEHEPEQKVEKARAAMANCKTCTRKTWKLDCIENVKTLQKHIKQVHLFLKRIIHFP